MSFGFKDISSPILDDYESHYKGYRTSLFANNQMLLVGKKEVIWLRNNELVRKIKYEDKEDRIVNAHLVSIPNDNKKPNSSLAKTKDNKYISLIIILANKGHIYSEDNETLLIRFPVNVQSSSVFEHGIILQKESSKLNEMDALLHEGFHLRQHLDVLDTPNFKTALTGTSNSLPSTATSATISLPAGPTSSSIIPLTSSFTSGSSKPQFFTLLVDQLSDIGTVVTSSTSSFSSTEQLIYSPSLSSECITITYDPLQRVVNVYHTRYINRNQRNQKQQINCTTNRSNGTRKRSTPSRSVSAKLTASANLESILGNSSSFISHSKLGTKSILDSKTNMMLDDGENKNHNGNEIHNNSNNANMLTIDRMASGDISILDIDESIVFPSSGIVPNVFNSNNHISHHENFRKDIVLSKVSTIPFISANNHLKAFVMAYLNSHAVVVVNNVTQDITLFIYNSNNLSNKKLRSESLYQKKYTLDGLDAIKAENGYFILLNCDHKSVRFIHPFLNLSSDCIILSEDSSFEISNLIDFYNEDLIISNSENHIKLLHFNIKPTDSLTLTCLQALKFFLHSYVYEYLWLSWCACFQIVKNDWQAFIISLLNILIQNDSQFYDITNGEQINLIVQLLPFAASINSNMELKMDPVYKESIMHLIPNIFLILHIIREDLRLDILSEHSLQRLDILLAQLSSWFGWPKIWPSYYLGETYFETMVDLNVRISTLQSLNSIPNILKSLASIFTKEIVPYVTLSQIMEQNETIDELITSRSYYMLRLFETIVSDLFSPMDVVNLLVSYKINSFDLDTYPLGISLPLKEYLAYAMNKVSIADNIELVRLLGRKDITKFMSFPNTNNVKYDFYHSSNSAHSSKDINQMIQSMKSDSTVANSVGENFSKDDKLSVTRLLFSKDRRYFEITSLLQSSKVQKATLKLTDALNETNLIDLQKKISVLASLRTLTIPLGRGALFLSSKIPILTEKYPVPKMNFDTLIQPGSITLSLDKSSVDVNTMDWGYFHNGVSTGLTIKRNGKKIASSWIVFNKPQVANPQHGGFLLGLGLNGQLTNLEEWHMYNYLGPKNTHVSVGLLLGTSASARGTMDVKLTKVLSVHVVALLPQGATDLNVALPVQTAGIIGIGLLYMETGHHRMSEILLTQISNRISVNEKFIANEGYRLAAGIALGYVNLGKGNDLVGLNDSHTTYELLSMAVSLKDVQGYEEYDKSAAGAIIALGLIYIKTGNTNIASKLQVPETQKLLDYIRPDLLLLRIVAKNLIMWNTIQNTKQWVESQIPGCLKKEFFIETINVLDSDQLNYFYCIAGACLSMAFKFCSTDNREASNTVLYYLDHFMKLTETETSCFDEEMTQTSVLTIQGTIALSAAIIVAGSGDLETFRRLRILHHRTNLNIKYSNYESSSLALGFLFLGSGEYAFDDSNFSIASLLTAVYPAPSGGETEIYLQALRNFWALAVSPRCLVFRDVDTNKPTNIPISVEFKEKKKKKKTYNTPCLIPNINEISNIQILSDEHFPINLDLVNLKLNQPELFNKLKDNLTMFVYSKKDFYPAIVNDDKNMLEFSNIFDNSEAQKLNTYTRLCDFIFGEEIEKMNNIHNNSLIDNTRFEVKSLIVNAKSVDDLWNTKVLLNFYDNLYDFKPYYLSNTFVELMKFELFKMSKS